MDYQLRLGAVENRNNGGRTCLTIEGSSFPFYVNIYEFLILLHLRFIHCYLMTLFPVDYDKFTILSKVRN